MADRFHDGNCGAPKRDERTETIDERRIAAPVANPIFKTNLLVSGSNNDRILVILTRSLRRPPFGAHALIRTSLRGHGS
jgi:hypothetical protein